MPPLARPRRRQARRAPASVAASSSPSSQRSMPASAARDFVLARARRARPPSAPPTPARRRRPRPAATRPRPGRPSICTADRNPCSRRSATAARPRRRPVRSAPDTGSTPPGAGCHACRAARSRPPPRRCPPVRPRAARPRPPARRECGRPRQSRAAPWPRSARRSGASMSLATTAAEPLVGAHRQQARADLRRRLESTPASSIVAKPRHRQRRVEIVGQRLDHRRIDLARRRHRQPRGKARRESPSTARQGSRSTAAASDNAPTAAPAAASRRDGPAASKSSTRDDIAERLRHLLRAHVDEAVVHPVTRQRLAAMRAAALRDLILMMREDEVEPAAVDVDRLAQMRADHRRAFDVPARPAAAPRAVPADHASLARLPQHEVGGVALVGRDLDPRAGDHRLAVAAAERAIIGVATATANSTWPSAS